MKNMKSNGFSMIEVLVTIVISAIGLLGLAAMQMVNLKNVNNTQYRSLAAFYANDMAERMRTNKPSVSEYNAVDTDGADICANCTAGGIAESDVTSWKALLTQTAANGGLPSGAGAISQDGDEFEIEVTWDEQVKATNGGQISQQTYVLTITI